MFRIVFLSVLTAVSVFADGFTVTSKAFGGQVGFAQVYNGFGCTGENISPDLAWENVPKGTESFAVTLYDPDAPTGSGWWHWVVYNIPADVRGLKAGSSGMKERMPKGAVEGKTSYGAPGFGGACPPVGDTPHRYILTVYALDTAVLDLGAGSAPELVGFYLNAHAIAKASLMAYYGR